ncbi:MAG: FKBP-type peptidyl-prolyl cis-trans isomerase [Eubacteriales bacterium]|nr:FKBP-type peptidyl-prolyl cis-trans isomerase [Eubacteriales bacterium]MDD4390616.1 FKBP-type peptidyl-prolyl cis-trans isomerase [Eubacteriales bacterium]
MRKKFAAIFMILCMVFTVTACGESNNKTVSFDYDYDLSEYIEMGKYKGIEYTPTPEATKTVVENGDTINLNYTGKINGEVFSGGTTPDEGAQITVGSAGYIEGFETGLVGMSIGSTKDLNLKFPDDYHSAEVAGKDVVFTVTVNEIITDNPMDVDRAAIWEKYVSDCVIKKYPKDEVNAVKDQYQQQYQSYADMYNMTFEEFLKAQLNVTKKEFDENAKLYAEGIVKQDMALFALARAEKIDVSDEEFEAARDDMLKSYNLANAEEFKQQYGVELDDKSVETSIKATALLKKVLDFVYDNAVAV